MARAAQEMNQKLKRHAPEMWTHNFPLHAAYILHSCGELNQNILQIWYRVEQREGLGTEGGYSGNPGSHPYDGDGGWWGVRRKMKRTQFLMRCDGVPRGLGVARPPDMRKLLTHQRTLDPMLCRHHGRRRRRQEHLRSRAPSTKTRTP
jgi:hypothetical protein